MKPRSLFVLSRSTGNLIIGVLGMFAVFIVLEVSWTRNEYVKSSVGRIVEMSGLSPYSYQQSWTCMDRQAQKYGRVEDIFCIVLPPFLPHLKNPCFYEYSLTKKKVLRCLPYFYIIGMDKCGSTDLHNRLAKHPFVFENKGSLGKETAFWSWLRYGVYNKRLGEKKLTVDEYLDMFVETANMIEQTNITRIITENLAAVEAEVQALIFENSLDGDAVIYTDGSVVRHVRISWAFTAQAGGRIVKDSGAFAETTSSLTMEVMATPGTFWKLSSIHFVNEEELGSNVYVVSKTNVANFLGSRVTNNDCLQRGDATPMDLWDFRSWPMIPQNFEKEEPEVLTPHLLKYIHRERPPKILVQFREPIERLYSDYIFLDYGKTPEEFHNHSLQAIDMMNDCIKNLTRRQCYFNDNLYHNLPEWFRVFPRSSFLITTMDEYQDDMETTLKKVFTFLDLPSLSESKMFEIINQTRRHVTKNKHGVVLPETAKVLRQFYDGCNKDTADLLNDDRFLWLDHYL